MSVYKLYEYDENKKYNDDDRFILDENFPRYIVEPFERVFKDDPRYETALTREQLNEAREKTKSIFSIIGKFEEHFLYECNVPDNLAFDNDQKAMSEFEQVIDKCIEDDFDYTIDLYGTKPLPPGDRNSILID